MLKFDRATAIVYYLIEDNKTGTVCEQCTCMKSVYVVHVHPACFRFFFTFVSRSHAHTGSLHGVLGAITNQQPPTSAILRYEPALELAGEGTALTNTHAHICAH